MTRRLVVNLVAFFAVSVALIVFGVVNLLGNPLQSPTLLSARFPNASGLFPHFTVELNGVDVGQVTGVRLDRGGAVVNMALNPGQKVPGDVVASVDIANDLGEQVVELTPTRGGTAPPLPSGAVVPVARGQIPADVGQVVATATRLLRNIPAGRLNNLLGDLSTALQGRAADLRTIVSAGTTFSREFLAYQRQFEALLHNAPPVMDAVSAEGPQLQQGLVNTEALLQVLATHKTSLDTLFTQGAGATSTIDNLVTNQSADLGCLLHDFAQINSNLSDPGVLANISRSLATNEQFFGAVQAVAVGGAAKPLRSGESTIPDQVFLRTRLLLPPATPSGIAYGHTTGLPAVEPGPACQTEFGPGAPAATQHGFSPADGGRLVAAPAATAQVRGGGDPPAGPPAAGAAYRSRSADPAALLGLGLVLPVLALLFAARPGRRRTRRRA
jgi:phospholipid/cholesterol/gamma-HCH transport system substrate-binding protein